MMTTSLALELHLIRVNGAVISPQDRRAIQTFVDDPTLNHWVEAGNVIVAVGRSPETLAARLVNTYRHYSHGKAFFTIDDSNGSSMWHTAPDVGHIVAIVRALARTNELPSIDLELDLARAADNKLTPSERIALGQLYYRPSVDALMQAKDIVLLEDGSPDGEHLTFILALQMVAPEWLEQNLGEEKRGNRNVKVFNAAPTWALTRAALVRATH